MDVSTLTLKTIREGFENKTFSSVELTQAYLDRIEKLNPKINAFVRIQDDVLDQASAIDKRRADGEELGALAGIPIGLKDNMLVKGQETTAGSQILEGHKSSYDGTVTARLKQAGAVIVGQTNMDEFAMGSSTESSHFGPTKNPWDLTKVPGGSSGGSAAAVASSMVPIALGSDTGGSIRQPASLCGVTGLKPTYGRVSRYGLMALASSLDQIGPFAKTVEDAAMVMQIIEGHDPKDGTSIDLTSTTAPELLDPSVKGLTFGLPKEYFVEGIDPEIKASVMEAVSVLERAGATIQEISMPHAEYALATYYIIMPSEASSNLGRFDGIRYGYHSMGSDLEDTYRRTRGEGFGSEAKRRIMLGAYTLSAGYYDAYYRKALQMRTLIKQDFDEALKYVDAIITPTSPSVAWGIGEKFNDPITMYLSDIYTVTANLATVPALSIPCGFVQDLPVGLQIMGRPFDEHTLYRVGAFYQSQTDWHTRTP